MKKFSLGLEAIDFQKDDIFLLVTQQYEILKKSKWKNKEAFKILDALILKRFGIKTVTSVNLNTEILSHTSIPWFVNTLHPFLNNELRKMIYSFTTNGSKDVVALFEELKKFNAINTVDLKNAKIAGNFSNIDLPVKMSIDGPFSTYTAEEFAAVYLHEVGHLFTWFETSIKTYTTNLVLSELCLLSQNISKQDKQIILKKAENVLELPQDSLVLISESTDEKVTATIFLDAVFKYQKSSTGSSFYDYTAREQVADQFVSRLGGGRHLVIALDKLNKDAYQYYTKYNEYKLVMTTVVLQAIALYLHPVIGLIYAMYTLSRLNKVHVNTIHYYGYDNDKVRLQRIRNDMSLMLKDSISDKEKQLLIIELEKIDTIIEQTKVFKTAFDRLGSFLNLPDISKRKEIYNLQRDLEDLAFNDLFIKAEKLRLS